MNIPSPPANGEKITMQDGQLQVPSYPIIPYIEGDGIGPDVWRATKKVLDAAVAKTYENNRQLKWMEVYAGEKANRLTGHWLPNDTLAACKEYRVAIKGPLTTPTGGGIRSLNVALRQLLDLYVCLRPIRWFEGVPSPTKQPQLVDMVIFRENTEDIYAGIEFASGSEENARFLELFKKAFPVHVSKDPLPKLFGYWHKTDLPARNRAAGQGGDPLCDR